MSFEARHRVIFCRTITTLGRLVCSYSQCTHSNGMKNSRGYNGGAVGSQQIQSLHVDLMRVHLPGSTPDFAAMTVPTLKDAIFDVEFSVHLESTEVSQQ